MTASIDTETGLITTYQGDTIMFNCTGIPTDVTYIVYFSIRDLSSADTIINEIPFYTNGNSSVQIFIPPSVTDLIPVPSDKKFKDYRWSLKACNSANNYEHTLLIGDTETGSEYKMRVYRKQTEGV